MTRAETNAALDRIYSITETTTQVALSEVLGIRQSSVSDARKRNSIPGAWLVTLVDRFSANPAWILTGEGPRYLLPSDSRDEMALAEETIEKIRAEAIAEGRRAALDDLTTDAVVDMLRQRLPQGAALHYSGEVAA
ncbi:helix-turn-helix domain-containing protein [Nitratidesulfovibrio vulgaris]|uniref:helix-turn-helix domain-containing protein n=1 Tax=Nitratidesulfovibrio vulgaris TaxID=881 RepID=UPI0022FFF21A|nr:helix-turn-helix domain-containing protein [Nitratidesulfovibrio vulgaris]WCB45247.1 helix-turn-helix domain-containing protein [Nitratidesulfovibrio vulgaris]